MSEDEDDKTTFRPASASPADTPPDAPIVPAAGPQDSTTFQPAGSAAEPKARKPRAAKADKTVIAPGKSRVRGDAKAGHDSDRTTFQPVKTDDAKSVDRTVIAAKAKPPAADTRNASGIKIGDILNHTYEVTRFIARGGMGEVYEGRNTTNDERVAIKVILPAMASDPQVFEMFRKEAQVLTRLLHPALVAYRTQSRDADLGVYYIVMDYIDGVSIGELMGKVQPSVEEMITLIRRVAGGLQAAHELGAIHRDIAPDNILLEEGQLHRARVIDFGIARDVKPGSKTVIGDGFAGRLGFAAPEQLGDFGGNVGPYSDIYSLALVLLALVQGKAPPLGGSYVEAIDKRRAGVDITGAPEPLRPLLRAMLVADPAKRLQSMNDVITMVDAVKAKAAKSGSATGGTPMADRAKAMFGAARHSVGKGSANRKTVTIAAAVGGALFLALVGWIAFGGGGAPPAGQAVVHSAVPAANVDAARTAALAALASDPCQWVQVSLTQGEGGLALSASGVSGSPDETERLVYNAVKKSGVAVASSDFSSGVASIDKSLCPILQKLAPYRLTGSSHIHTSQAKYEIGPLENSVLPKGARVITDVSLGDLSGEVGLVGVEKDGQISTVVANRRALDDYVQQGALDRLPGVGNYRLQADASPTLGWFGMVLLSGDGNLESVAKALDPKVSAEQFRKEADAHKLNADIAWYQLVDQVPD